MPSNDGKTNLKSALEALKSPPGVAPLAAIKVHVFNGLVALSPLQLRPSASQTLDCRPRILYRLTLSIPPPVVLDEDLLEPESAKISSNLPRALRVHAHKLARWHLE